MKITRNQLRRIIKEEVQGLFQRKMDRDNTSSGDVVSVSRVGTAVVDFLDDPTKKDHADRIKSATGDAKMTAIYEFLHDLADDLDEDSTLWKDEDAAVSRELALISNFLDDMIVDAQGDTVPGWPASSEGISRDYFEDIAQYVDRPSDQLRNDMREVEAELRR